MGEQDRKPRTAAEEVEQEIREAETDVTGREEAAERDGEGGDATSPNVDAQRDAGGQDR